MFADGHVKAAAAGKYSGLLLHRAPGAVHFILTEADRAAAAAHADAAARAGVLLLRVVIVAVLLAGHRQVAADLQRHLLATDLRTGQRGVPAADNVEIITGADGGFIVAGAVTAFAASSDIDAGVQRQPVGTLTKVDADANGGSLALVFSLQFLAVLRRNQVQVTRRAQACIPARLQLAALNVDVGLAGGNAQIIAGRQLAALVLVLRHRLFRF